jgi:hypothetical protein
MLLRELKEEIKVCRHVACVKWRSLRLTSTEITLELMGWQTNAKFA